MTRQSKISQEDGILGPYHDSKNPKMVHVGQIQDMCFPSAVNSDHDDDPFDMTVEQRFAKRFDVSTATDRQTKDKTKQELEK